MIINIPLTALFSIVASGPRDTGPTAALPLLQLVSWLVGMAYFVYFIGSRGQTLGKRALGIKVVPEANPSQPIGYTNAFLREVVGKFLSAIVLFLGYLWMLWDDKKQTWHDKIAKTVVIRV